jgi:serine/threonine-protein kinase
MATSGVVSTPPQTTARSGQIATGATLAGKYSVGRVVGIGGVGIVFEALNTDVEKRVALKCLRPELFADAGMVSRFSREAKAAAAIKSEYVASVYDVGTSPDGVPYMVMELLDGKDLSSSIAEAGRFAVRKAVECTLQVCEALAIAHAKGIVHRDIKPENLFLTEQGGLPVVKVVDFGISKIALSGEATSETGGADMGSPLYMAPEQIRSAKTVDVRSDIWSLGMVLYELLAGKPGFDSSSIPQLCVSILQAEPPSIQSLREDVPEGLANVIKKCLRKDVERRYQNVAELALALMPFGPSRGRLSAERAFSVLQASGHVSPDETFPSMLPGATGEHRISQIPKAALVPKVDVSAPPPASPGAQPAPPEKKPVVMIVALVVAFIAAAIAVAAAANLNRTSAPPADTGSSTAKP